jgi:hypothetical protein
MGIKRPKPQQQLEQTLIVGDDTTNARRRANLTTFGRKCRRKLARHSTHAALYQRKLAIRYTAR